MPETKLIYIVIDKNSIEPEILGCYEQFKDANDVLESLKGDNNIFIEGHVLYK